MTDILQIFKTEVRIEKPEYTAETRQSIGAWESVLSKTGFLEGNTLFLPADSEQALKIQQVDLLIIQDINGFDQFAAGKSLVNPALPKWYKDARRAYELSTHPQLKGFAAVTKRRPFELFEFNKTEDGSIEILFIYDNSIGTPKRQNHKIAEIQKGQSIRFKVNGKTDHTMTRGKQRTFSEYDYIFHFTGTAANIEFKAASKIETLKTIPTWHSKLIDERKILH